MGGAWRTRAWESHMATATEQLDAPLLDVETTPETSAFSGPMTTEEMLALPEGEVDRELFLGELRERAMTTRNVPHSYVNGRIGFILHEWAESRPEP